MNNFHIYEEVGRGKYSVVYKVSSENLYSRAWRAMAILQTEKIIDSVCPSRSFIR
jgi:hypothetical protein